jgi:glyoxylase-like metal-dependent hydrolase (beta-lactamase superfamily II)
MAGPAPKSWVVDPAATRAFEVGPGLWQLRLPLPWPQIPYVNAFTLPLEDGGIALVDCGSAGDETLWEALVRGLELAGHGVAEVRRVVYTHYHSDHAGVLERLREGGAEIVGHPAIEAFVDGTLHPGRIAAARHERARREGVPDWLLPACADVREETDGILAPTPPDLPLRDGDVVASALGPWTVLETPGHAPSHVCLHQPELGVAIVGDVLAAGFYPYFDYGYTADPVAEYFATLERLEQLEGVTLALVGHGRPVDDLAGTTARWRGQLHDRLDAAEAAVEAGATNAWEVTARLFDVEAAGDLAAFDLGEVLAYLRHLRRTGRLVRRTGPDGSFRYAAAPAAGVAQPAADLV